jgi:ubiquinone/menaquinone biosynthesis C-methylase UbiE
MIAYVDVERDWRAAFEQTYSGSPSRVAERVWRRVFGDEYPVGIDPFSLISRSELERFAVELHVGETGTIADLGCGRGGPGLWVAMATGARLIGVDIAAKAVEAARERARAMGLEGRAQFKQGTFDETALAAGSAEALMSVDALLFAPDKRAALAEFRRLLPKGGRLVFTSWDYHSQPVGRPPQVDDHRPLLDAVGFDVLAYDETEEWRERVTQTTAGLLENVEALAAETGDSAGEVRTQLLEMQAAGDAMSRRVLAVAETR